MVLLIYILVHLLSKVTSEEKDVAYILKTLTGGAGSGVFKGDNSEDDVTLALKVLQLVFILDKLLVEILLIMNKKKMMRVNLLLLLNIFYFF